MYSSSSEQQNIAAIYREYGKCEYIKYLASVGNKCHVGLSQENLNQLVYFAEKAPRPR
jgi:hypothetical protein